MYVLEPNRSQCGCGQRNQPYGCLINWKWCAFMRNAELNRSHPNPGQEPLFPAAGSSGSSPKNQTLIWLDRAIFDLKRTLPAQLKGQNEMNGNAVCFCGAVVTSVDVYLLNRFVTRPDLARSFRHSKAQKPSICLPWKTRLSIANLKCLPVSRSFAARSYSCPTHGPCLL